MTWASLCYYHSWPPKYCSLKKSGQRWPRNNHLTSLTKVHSKSLIHFVVLISVIRFIKKHLNLLLKAGLKTGLPEAAAVCNWRMINLKNKMKQNIWKECRTRYKKCIIERMFRKLSQVLNKILQPSCHNRFLHAFRALCCTAFEELLFV